jgi:hypothetical protein
LTGTLMDLQKPCCEVSSTFPVNACGTSVFTSVHDDRDPSSSKVIHHQMDFA